MALFGKKGFVRKQEVQLAARLLVWKYEKAGIPVPSNDFIRTHAERIVDEAHEIAKESGSSVMAIVKDQVKNLRRKMG